MNIQDISVSEIPDGTFSLACAQKNPQNSTKLNQQQQKNPNQIIDNEFYFLFSSELWSYFLIQVIKLINVAPLGTSC